MTPQFLLGVGLVLFGGLLTLDRMQIVDVDVSFRFWPLLLVALGGWIVVDRGDTRRAWPGYAMAGAGALLLMNNFGLIRVRFWELVWPLLVVFIGVRLIMQRPGPLRRLTSFGQGDAASASSTDGTGTINMVSIFGGSKRASNDKPFRGGEMVSIVGGTQLDLRQATIEPGQHAAIEIFSILGGHELWVPQGWTVVNDVIPVLGGVEDKRLPPVDGGVRLATDTPPRLVLKGLVVLGGLIIKS
jgi:hypothetical protein